MNKTRFRSLDKMGSDPRIEEIYQDIDGIWIEPRSGWTFDPLSAHGAHVDTAREALRCYPSLVSCACVECKPAPAAGEGEGR